MMPYGSANSSPRPLSASRVGASSPLRQQSVPATDATLPIRGTVSSRLSKFSPTLPDVNDPAAERQWRGNDIGDRSFAKQPHATTSPRTALRPISQGPGELGHTRIKSYDSASAQAPDSSPRQAQSKSRPHSLVISRADSIRARSGLSPRGSTGPTAPAHSPSHPDLGRPHLQELQRSSTVHLRNLSKFAENHEPEELSITNREQEVAGLHGRRRLQRDQSVRNVRGGDAGSKFASGYSHTKWMDQQRQFLQAYEYLCHIGEAKEWIEDIIHKPIPPIVELEEALRDGVTLAEVIQALHPERPLRIFRNPKLQFRHSDNIALFFRFLAEADLPELFRFELVDLYEKKNIPKVIYCIHALSWLLYRNGIVDFRIGNLVGQLQFEDHELERTQQGLDKAGVSMPNFSGMSASFDVEPEPPKETAQERIDRELEASSASTAGLQMQIRGALVRLRLGDMMQAFWDREAAIIQLQACIRADQARQVISYRLDMRGAAIRIQSAARAALVRRQFMIDRKLIRDSAPRLSTLQAAIRARACRSGIHQQKKDMSRQYHDSMKMLQAQIRGALARWAVGDQYFESRENEDHVVLYQSMVRGFLARTYRKRQDKALRQAMRPHANWQHLQSRIRARHVRNGMQARREEAVKTSGAFTPFQSALRGRQARRRLVVLQQALAEAGGDTSLQNHARGMILRRTREDDMRNLHRCEDAVEDLQACARAYMQRNQILAVLFALGDEQANIVSLQSSTRAFLGRGRIGVVLAEVEQQEETIIELQSLARAQLVRQRFAEKQKHYKENMAKVIKVQSIVRGRQQGEAYKSLTTGRNPPINTVKSFVHLLNDSDFDFDEELEFERMRKTVTQQVRQNEMAEQYIDQLDIKIALLVKNKITLDEVVRHQKQFGYVGGLLNSREVNTKDQFDLRALNKTSRKKLEHYQELFYVLQTQPQYLARLFRHFREQGLAEKESKKMEILMLGVFGFAQKRREEYYLLKLFAQSIQEEATACGSLVEYLRSSFFWTKLLSVYLRSPRDRKYMKQLFGPVVREDIFSQEGLDLESDPRQIYRAAINNEELRTGQRSQRSPDIPREEAIRDPATRQAFVAHLQDLRDIADHFFALLGETMPQMPFGVRYVAQQQFEVLKATFPREDEQHLLQTVGLWIWKTYLLPALIQPEMCGVIDRGLGPTQKKNLGEVARAIGQVFSGKLFGGENVYLQPLNAWVSESMDCLAGLMSDLINIRPAERHFDVDEFNDMYSRTKPKLYIKMSDILAVHHLLAADPQAVCASRDDGMREILRELGSAKSNESEMSAMGAQEISLQLTPKFHDVRDPDADMKTLFMETKRLILYIIRIQSGSSLLEILVKPISEDDEDKWHSLLEAEARGENGGRVAGMYAASISETASPAALVDVGSMTYAEVKSAALENILMLERRGQVHRHDQYQAILNSIALDIRTKHRRRVERARELDGVRATLAQIESKTGYLEEQLQSYNDYVEQAMVTLQHKKGKKRFLLPFTKQYNHEKELARSGRTPKFGSFKYSARSLAEKGVLVDWKGYSEDKWSRINITISSDEVGVFHVEGSSGSLMIPGASASVPLDDMLQAQFENLQYINLFSDKSLRLNVNLLLNLVYRKFFD